MNDTQEAGKIPPSTIWSWGSALVLFAMLATLLGCTTIRYPAGPVTPPPSYKFLTGNWEFTAAPTVGATQFGLLAGFIDEQSVDAGVDDPTTALLQVEDPGTCFLGTSVVPLLGDLKGTELGLTSFSDVSQFITINATKDATATHLTGTYAVGGGCASGSQGTLSGIKYAPLSGSYSGSVSGSNSTSAIALALNQSLQGNGDGTSNVTGSATITGNACFSTATLSPGDGSVLGSKVNLLFDTNETGAASQMMVLGTFDAAADLITATSITVTGGACSGALGTANLQLQ